MLESRISAMAMLAAFGSGYASPLPIKRSKYSPGFYANREVGRNAPCPCESGKKYKKCCQRVDPRVQLAALAEGMDEVGEPCTIPVF